MGKKGKKKGKVTGTPDVVKFKATREFCLLKECVTIQESLPFVAVDPLDELAFKRVARFLNMVGLLAEHLQVQSSKDFRFAFHHKYLAPTPQYFPFGFDHETIRAARQVQERPGVVYNGEEYPFSEELKELSEKFLKEVDGYMTKIAADIEPQLKDDFPTGLKRFKAELKEDLEAFDELWTKFEREHAVAQHAVLTQVFAPVDRLVATEQRLSEAEGRLDIEMKQRLENEFVRRVEDFTHFCCPETAGAGALAEDAVPLAESCIFYESKFSEEHLHHAKYLIKDYLELRSYVHRIPQERLRPSLRDNPELMRLLRSFHASALAAQEALDFAARLPKLIQAKTWAWMTKTLLEPDLEYIRRTAHVAARELAQPC